MTSKTDERIRRAAAPAVEEECIPYLKTDEEAGAEWRNKPAVEDAPRLGTCRLVSRPHPQESCGEDWRPLPAGDDATPRTPLLPSCKYCYGTGSTEGFTCNFCKGSGIAEPRMPLRDLAAKWRTKTGWGASAIYGKCAEELDAALRAATPQPRLSAERESEIRDIADWPSVRIQPEVRGAFVDLLATLAHPQGED